MNRLPLVGPLGRFTWRMLATVLVGQALAVFFGALVARALAAAQDDGRSTAYLVIGSTLAVLCLVAAGLMRGRWGVTLGWLIQVATFVSAVVVPMMAVVGVLFAGLWVYCLVKGTAVDAEMARREAESAEGTR